MGCGASKAAEEAARKEEEERMKKAQAGAGGRKRGSVAAQGGMDPTKMKVDLATLPKIEKSAEALEHIKTCVAGNILFKSLSQEYTDAIIASMSEVQVKSGEAIIKQGEAGTNWYVVEKGSFDAFKKMEGDEEPGKKVKSYEAGGSFGELALMYNQRRAASVIASSDSVIWSVPQDVFKQLILTASMQNKTSYD